MAEVDISLADGTGVNWSHRLRCIGDGDDSWHAVVTDNSNHRDTVQNGSIAQIAVWQASNNGSGNYVIDRTYFSFDLSGVPADATITAVSDFFTVDIGLRAIADSDAEKMRLVKSTTDSTVANGTTTANAIDHTVNNGSDVTMPTDNSEVEFDLGSSGLYDWVVSQHAAGERGHMYMLSKMEYDSFVSSGATEPSGVNRSGICSLGHATTSKRPRMVVTFTPAPSPPVTKIQIKGGQTKILSGNLKIKG